MRTTAITPVGMGFLGASSVALPIGLFTYSGPILALGCLGLILIGIAYFFARRHLNPIVARRALPKRVFPGQTFEIETALEVADGKTPARQFQLVDHLKVRKDEPLNIKYLPSQKTTRLKYSSQLFQRGRITRSNYTLKSQWPFGFFETVKNDQFRPMRPGDESMLVAPKPLIPRDLKNILHQIEQESGLFSPLNPDEPTEIKALREFRPGDPIKSIHWPASTRGGELIVKESDPPIPKPQRHGIYLHQYLPPGQINQPDRFERILRIACGLLIHFWQREVALVVRMDNRSGVEQWFSLPEETRFEEILDRMAEAVSRPTNSLDHFQNPWDHFADCDQVFILGDSSRKYWEEAAAGKHPSLVCIDPSSANPRNPPVKTALKPQNKLITQP